MESFDKGMTAFNSEYDKWVRQEQQLPRKDRDPIIRQMEEDFRTLFFGSLLGQKVFADLLKLTGHFDAKNFGNSWDIFENGKRYIMATIVSYCGLDDAKGLIDIAKMMAKRDEELKNLEGST